MAPGSEQGEDVLEAGGDGAALKAAMESWLDQALELRAEFTTVAGLIVAIILQIFYNYILSKIDSIVLDMEEASMDLVDLLYKRNLEGK